MIAYRLGAEMSVELEGENGLYSRKCKVLEIVRNGDMAYIKAAGRPRTILVSVGRLTRWEKK